MYRVENHRGTNGTGDQKPNHASSMVDQSFQSLKSKEVRDSCSPTKDFQDHKWNVQEYQETSPDGKMRSVGRSADRSYIERSPGKVANYSAQVDASASVYEDRSDNSFQRSVSSANRSKEVRSESSTADEPIKTTFGHVPDSVKNDPNTKVYTERKTLPDGSVMTTRRYVTSASGENQKSGYKSLRQIHEEHRQKQEKQQTNRTEVQQQHVVQHEQKEQNTQKKGEYKSLRQIHEEHHQKLQQKYNPPQRQQLEQHTQQTCEENIAKKQSHHKSHKEILEEHRRKEEMQQELLHQQRKKTIEKNTEFELQKLDKQYKDDTVFVAKKKPEQFTREQQREEFLQEQKREEEASRANIKSDQKKQQKTTAYQVSDEHTNRGYEEHHHLRDDGTMEHKYKTSKTVTKEFSNVPEVVKNDPNTRVVTETKRLPNGTLYTIKRYVSGQELPDETRTTASANVESQKIAEHQKKSLRELHEEHHKQEEMKQELLHQQRQKVIEETTRAELEAQERSTKKVENICEEKPKRKSLREIHEEHRRKEDLKHELQHQQRKKVIEKNTEEELIRIDKQYRDDKVFVSKEKPEEHYERKSLKELHEEHQREEMEQERLYQQRQKLIEEQKREEEASRINIRSDQKKQQKTTAYQVSDEHTDRGYEEHHNLRDDGTMEHKYKTSKTVTKEFSNVPEVVKNDPNTRVVTETKRLPNGTLYTIKRYVSGQELPDETRTTASANIETQKIAEHQRKSLRELHEEHHRQEELKQELLHQQRQKVIEETTKREEQKENVCQETKHKSSRDSHEEFRQQELRQQQKVIEQTGEVQIQRVDQYKDSAVFIDNERRTQQEQEERQKWIELQKREDEASRINIKADKFQRHDQNLDDIATEYKSSKMVTSSYSNVPDEVKKDPNTKVITETRKLPDGTTYTVRKYVTDKHIPDEKRASSSVDFKEQTIKTVGQQKIKEDHHRKIEDRKSDFDSSHNVQDDYQTTVIKGPDGKKRPSPCKDYEQPERRQPIKPHKGEMETGEPTEGQYDTTYRSDFTNKKIHQDVSATHDAFVRSLRSVTPERKFSRPCDDRFRYSSRISPDKPQHFGSNETITYPSSKKDTLNRKSPERKSLRRTDTYEERVRQILGLDDKKKSTDQHVRKSSLTERRGSGKTPKRESPEKSKRRGSSPVQEYPAQIRSTASPERSVPLTPAFYSSKSPERTVPKKDWKQIVIEVLGCYREIEEITDLIILEKLYDLIKVHEVRQRIRVQIEEVKKCKTERKSVEKKKTTEKNWKQIVIETLGSYKEIEEIWDIEILEQLFQLIIVQEVRQRIQNQIQIVEEKKKKAKSPSRKTPERLLPAARRTPERKHWKDIVIETLGYYKEIEEIFEITILEKLYVLIEVLEVRNRIQTQIDKIKSIKREKSPTKTWKDTVIETLGYYKEIEEIWQLEILEKLLIVITVYEVRQRIEKQIERVKKTSRKSPLRESAVKIQKYDADYQRTHLKEIITEVLGYYLDIEEIWELEILEKLLEIIIVYEIRQRILIQIEEVNKKIERENRPSYMKPLDKSVRLHSPNKSSVIEMEALSKGEILQESQKLTVSDAVTFDKQSLHDIVVNTLGFYKEIEDIYDLDVLQKLHSVVVVYEVRKRIENQIDFVKSRNQSPRSSQERSPSRETKYKTVDIVDQFIHREKHHEFEVKAEKHLQGATKRQKSPTKQEIEDELMAKTTKYLDGKQVEVDEPLLTKKFISKLGDADTRKKKPSVKKDLSRDEEKLEKLKQRPEICISSRDISVEESGGIAREIIVDLKRSHSTKEPTTNKIHPVCDDDKGKPRYPDKIQEPEDQKPITNLNDMIINEEGDDVHKISEIIDINIETNLIDNETDDCLLTATDNTQQTTKTVTSVTIEDVHEEPDECLLSVQDKVQKFTTTVEEKKTPKQVAPKIARPDLSDVDESLKSDECLLSVSDKVTKFVEKAQKVKTPKADVREPGATPTSSKGPQRNVIDIKKTKLFVEDIASRPSIFDAKKSMQEFITEEKINIETGEVSNQVPNYMKGLDRSLKANSPHKETINKFGVTLKRTEQKKKVDQVEIKEDLEKIITSILGCYKEIEEIFDLIVLEKILEVVTGYEIRRRIRAQIRLVREEASKVKTTESRATKSIAEKTSKQEVTKTRKSVSPKRDKVEIKVSKPEWINQRQLLKKPSERTIATKKFTSSTIVKQEQAVKRKSPSKDLDSVTSSYGVGPTDENGSPLFGLKALRAQKKVQGVVTRSTFVSENGQAPVGQVTQTKYSTDPKDFNGDSLGVNYKNGVMSKTVTRKFGNQTEKSTMSTSDKKKTTNDERAKTSLTNRRGSVKEMSQKFADSSAQKKSERVDKNYKAGLILRTSSFKNEGSKKDTFLSNTSKVSGMQDVITRMKNEEYVEGDSQQDFEARNLLNKFLGSQVILSGMEGGKTTATAIGGAATLANRKTKITGKNTKSVAVKATTTVANDGNQTKRTTKITTTVTENGVPKTTTRTFTHPISAQVLETINCEQSLRLLLEQSTEYDERRQIREKLKQVMEN